MGETFCPFRRVAVPPPPDIGPVWIWPGLEFGDTLVLQRGPAVSFRLIHTCRMLRVSGTASWGGGRQMSLQEQRYQKVTWVGVNIHLSIHVHISAPSGALSLKTSCKWARRADKNGP